MQLKKSPVKPRLASSLCRFIANVLRLWRQRMDCKQCAAVQVCVDLVYLRKPTSTCGTSVNITFACKSPEHIVRFTAKLTASRWSSGLKRVLKHSTHVRHKCAALVSGEPGGVCGCSLMRRAVSGRHLWRLLWCASLRANAASTHICLRPPGLDTAALRREAFLQPVIVEIFIHACGVFLNFSFLTLSAHFCFSTSIQMIEGKRVVAFHQQRTTSSPPPPPEPCAAPPPPPSPPPVESERT